VNWIREVRVMNPSKLVLALLVWAAAVLSGCGFPASCEASSDCPQATVCALGVCRLECPCGEGEACIEGACYTQQCDSGLVCAAGSVCMGDTCGDPLCGGQDCGTKVCDPASQRCVECLDDAQCPWTSFRCNTASGECACEQTEAPEESCADGADNDCDRAVDCADTSCDGRACAGSGTCRANACCRATTTREENCSDGVDDDCDGKIDCADDNCIDRLCQAEGACTNASVCLANGTCAAATNKPATTQCRPGGSDACDPAEFCTGNSPTCPPDGVAAAGTVCRGRLSEDLCDRIEVCDGSSPTCPADGLEPSGTVCRPAAGPCDREDVCGGSSKTCVDLRRLAGTTCDPAHGACDPADTCNGSSVECPAKHEPQGTACSLDTNPCTVDQCNGSGACVAPALPDEASCPGGASGSVCCGGMSACFDLQTDENHCGDCSRSCSAETTCTGGECCVQCPDDPDGTLCCGTRKCVFKTIDGELKNICQ
jgi:hypothetical protein